MSQKRICKYCGMDLSEDVQHGLRECHLRAVARIAELEAALINARELIGMTPQPAFPAWIPVSERLPEVDGYYWTMDFFKEEQKYKYIQKKKKWYDQSGMAVEFRATHVTHWMPLPEPPIVYGKVCEE
jgi:hypothetical protein